MPWQNVRGPHEVDSAKVAEIARAMELGYKFPPVRVVQYGQALHIIDGHHRVSAARSLGYQLSALVADGDSFEDLDCELRAESAGRADDELHWLGNGAARATGVA